MNNRWGAIAMTWTNRYTYIQLLADVDGWYIFICNDEDKTWEQSSWNKENDWYLKSGVELFLYAYVYDDSLAEHKRRDINKVDVVFVCNLKVVINQIFITVCKMVENNFWVIFGKPLV